ncbi:MAG: response regulator transcription factor [Ktedonobacteraceae bacterium]|nr:response regulator transcription factor [Ktedonobacteraceae bacterium]
MAQTILVVDDDAALRDAIACNLERIGYVVLKAADGAAALDIARREKLSLILLDIMLPDIDGLEVCRRLRRAAATATIPILMLTARGEEIDKVIGLEVGADDYVTKPFGRRELLSRVRALLRRAERSSSLKSPFAEVQDREKTPAPRELTVGPLRIDLAGRRVYIRGEVLDLQPKQFDLLVYFVRHQGTVITREQLLLRVWGYEYTGDTRTVDVHVRWLREKLEEDPANPQLLQTVRGVGYVLRWS